MNAITEGFETLAERRAAHRKVRADLTELREAHAKAGEKAKRLRVRFADVAGDPAEAEKVAAEIATTERTAQEHERLVAEYAAQERQAQAAINGAERAIVALHQRRRGLEETLGDSAAKRAQLARKAEEAERTADARRDLLAQHDAVMGSVKAQLADVSEPEPEAA